jgi:hypothetical protein
MDDKEKKPIIKPVKGKSWKDKNGVELIQFSYKDDDNPGFIFGVIYQPGKEPLLFGKCLVEKGVNIPTLIRTRRNWLKPWHEPTRPLQRVETT